MTKAQINTIFNKYGGRDKVIKEKLFTIYTDNNKEFFVSPTMTEKERVNAIKFDDSNEILEVTENNYLWMNINDRTPTNATTFIPYEVIQSITIMNGLSE